MCGPKLKFNSHIKKKEKIQEAKQFESTIQPLKYEIISCSKYTMSMSVLSIQLYIKTLINLMKEKKINKFPLVQSWNY